MEKCIRTTREKLRSMSSTIDDLMDLGKKEEAEHLLAEALQASTDDQAYHLFFQAEEALYIEKDHRTRERLLSEGVKAAPEDAFLLRNLGGGYLMDEKYSKARRLLERALEAAPEDADTLRDLGLLSSARGRESQAMAWYQQAIEINPADNDSMRQIGVSYSKLGRDQEAIGWYKKALECCEQDYDAMRQMGISLAMLGDYEKALSWLNRALEINPGDIDSKRNLRLAKKKQSGKGTTFVDAIMIRLARKLTLAWRRLIDRLDQPQKKVT